MSLSIIVMGASGRMGTTIANLAKEQGMTLAAVLERPERLDALAHWGCLAGTDPEVVYPQVPGAVVIDFTAPEASLANARCAVKNGNPIVIGTTGFTPEQKAELDAIAQNGRVFWSPNMSVGVNVLLELLPELVQMLGPDYDLEMVELHHNRKKDSPKRYGVAPRRVFGFGQRLGPQGCCLLPPRRHHRRAPQEGNRRSGHPRR